MKRKMPDKLVKEINRIFHEEEAKLYDERHPEIEREKENWNYVLSKYLPYPPEKCKVLDIGTGTGFVPSVIDRYLEDSIIIATDISQNMLLNAKLKLGNLRNDLESAVCDVEILPIRDNSIDIITINSTLHHIPNYLRTLKEIARILSREGILFIMHEPNKLFYHSLLPKINYVFQLYLNLKFKLKRRQGKKKDWNKFFNDVNQRLLIEGLIEQPLSPRQIQMLVDIHSPTASGIPDKEKGFVPAHIASQLKDLRLIEMKTYNYLEKTDPGTDLLSFLLNKVLARLFPGKGYNFSMVLGKRRGQNDND